jgi:hypothetical protein
MSTPLRPKQTITPDSFSVAPELLGKPLASPSRRAVAMGIDLILLAILIRLGGGAFLGLAAAFVLLRAANRFGNARLVPRWTRNWLRLIAAGLVFVAGIQLWRGISNRNGADEDSNDAEAVAADPNFPVDNLNLSIGQGAALAGIATRLRSEENAATAQRLTDSLARMLRRAGADPEQMEEFRETAHDIAGSAENDVVRTAIDSAFGAPIHASNRKRDSLAVQYAAAIQRRDSAVTDSLRVALRNGLAGRQLDELRSTVARQKESISSLQKENEQLKGRSVQAAVSGVFDDLGLGFGWFAVYFTGFLAMMRGQTPGKKAMGICVVRLDAKPISWWIAFERFGGYAASFTLGMLGFFQILWDRNRQGLHDKAVETVVIRVA